MRSYVVLRFLGLLLLLSGLGGCAVYNRIFHPYRITNPPLSAEYKAKMKADKAKKKAAAASAKSAQKKKKTATAADTESMPDPLPEATADNSNDADKATDEAAKKQPSASRAHYNSQGLLKKSKLSRPKPLHKVSKPSPWQRFKNMFRKHGKKHKAAPKPTPDEALPSPTPDAGP